MAIAVGCVAIGAALGFGGGLAGGVISWGHPTFGVVESLSTALQTVLALPWS